MKFIWHTFIILYKKTLSPIWHYFNPNGGCRFYPTCSEYSQQAVDQLGLVKGLLKSFYRIIKCHPFNKGGYDPFHKQ